MIAKNRVQTLALSILASMAIFASSPAMAGETNNESNIPEAVVNLDLCTLAYQLYHQSLCLQLDPWYDVFSRIGSDRRDNICRFTHDYATKLGSATSNDPISDQGFYTGPNAARGWPNSNTNLDPIITNYKHIDAKLPTFNRDGERFMAVAAPAYITQNIKQIDVVRYNTKPTSLPSYDVQLQKVRQYPGGTDHLIVFEGGTGIAGNTDPAWSPMGFVLMKKTATGYDAHIVFRGSRSGSAISKTVWKAQDIIGDAKGNPDWITDLRSSKQIDQPLISKYGKVTQGFAEALPTMLGPITACCKYLEQNYPAPEHTYVTGHSLGAGLASQFASAVLQGSFGDSLRNEVKGWSWDNLTLMAYAQPIPGDPTWAEHFDKISPASQHYWVSGDMVVEASANAIVGLLIDKGAHTGVQNKLNTLANCEENPHEVFVIRAGILRDLTPTNPTLVQQLGQQNTWGYYATFAKMMAGQPQSYLYPGAPAPTIVTEENLRPILANANFETEFENWLEQVYARMIVDKSSYIGPKFQSTLDERRQLVLDIVQHMKKPAAGDSAQEIDNLAKEFELIDGNLGLTNEEQWIYCGTILSRIQKTPLPLKELMANPVIKTSLESKFD